MSSKEESKWFLFFLDRKNIYLLFKFVLTNPDLAHRLTRLRYGLIKTLIYKYRLLDGL